MEQLIYDQARDLVDIIKAKLHFNIFSWPQSKYFQSRNPRLDCNTTENAQFSFVVENNNLNASLAECRAPLLCDKTYRQSWSSCILGIKFNVIKCSWFRDKILQRVCWYKITEPRHLCHHEELRVRDRLMSCFFIPIGLATCFWRTDTIIACFTFSHHTTTLISRLIVYGFHCVKTKPPQQLKINSQLIHTFPSSVN